MKISELHIDGFGHFSDASIGPFDSPVVILYGPNEAGKSTLLEFMRTVLFGFPRQNRDQHYPALAGGRHGGRIAILDDIGNRYVIERHAGVRGGPVTVQNESGHRPGNGSHSTARPNTTAAPRARPRTGSRRLQRGKPRHCLARDYESGHRRAHHWLYSPSSDRRPPCPL